MSEWFEIEVQASPNDPWAPMQWCGDRMERQSVAFSRGQAFASDGLCVRLAKCSSDGARKVMHQFKRPMRSGAGH